MTDAESRGQVPRLIRTPPEYLFVGGFVTALWALWFFAGPRIPYIAPKSELIESIGSNPWFLPVYIVMAPGFLYIGMYLGSLFWLLRGGDANAG